MKINEIIDKLREADFYIYEEEATSIKFSHNFLNGCNLAISLDGEINLIDDSTYKMKLSLYNETGCYQLGISELVDVLKKAIR